MQLYCSEEELFLLWYDGEQTKEKNTFFCIKLNFSAEMNKSEAIVICVLCNVSTYLFTQKAVCVYDF